MQLGANRNRNPNTVQSPIKGLNTALNTTGTSNGARIRLPR
jgi:hypothetical protein